MVTIEELIDHAPNVLLDPQAVIDALGMDPEIGLVEIEVMRPDYEPHGLRIWFGFADLSEEGEPLFSEQEDLHFEYENFSERIIAGDLASFRTWLIEKNNTEGGK